MRVRAHLNKIELRVVSEVAQASVELEGFVVRRDALVEAKKYTEDEINNKELISRLYRKN